MLAAARAFLTSPPPAWSLAFLGGVGCGKTHILGAMAGALIADRRIVRYVTTADLFVELRRAMHTDKSDPDAVLDELIDEPWLLIDELPAASVLTDWQAEQLDRLINARYRQLRPTVVASNGRLEALPPRIADRLEEGEIVITAGVPSWRKGEVVAAGVTAEGREV